MMHGADYSNNQTQGQMVRHLDANPSIRFALVKATQGTHFIDKTMAEKLVELHRRGLLCGVYHWLEDGDGAAQWDYFEARIRVARGIVPVICAVDYEDKALLGNLARGDAICRAFIARAHARGFKVGKYGSSGRFRQSHGEDWEWVAWWNPTPPPFKWDIWQMRGSPLDLDVSPHGDLGGLVRWWNQAASGVRPARPGKVWYVYDPATGETLGPETYLSVGARVTAHLRTRPKTTSLQVSRRGD